MARERSVNNTYNNTEDGNMTYDPTCVRCRYARPGDPGTHADHVTRAHYHWGQNIPGYLPMADEPNIAADWGTARGCLLEDLERAGDLSDVDDYAPGLAASWTEAMDDIRGASDGDSIYVNVCSGNPHDLGVSYWLEPCFEDECLADDPEAGHANHASAAILLMVAGTLAAGAWQMLERAAGMLGGVG